MQSSDYYHGYYVDTIVLFDVDIISIDSSFTILISLPGCHVLYNDSMNIDIPVTDWFVTAWIRSLVKEIHVYSLSETIQKTSL